MEEENEDEWTKRRYRAGEFHWMWEIFKGTIDVDIWSKDRAFDIM